MDVEKGTLTRQPSWLQLRFRSLLQRTWEYLYSWNSLPELVRNGREKAFGKRLKEVDVTMRQKCIWARNYDFANDREVWEPTFSNYRSIQIIIAFIGEMGVFGKLKEVVKIRD